MISPLVAQSSWNMTYLDTKLKAIALSSWRTTQLKWRSRVHLMLWITISQPSLVSTPNLCGEKCVAKASRNWKHKTWLVNWYNVSWAIRKVGLNEKNWHLNVASIYYFFRSNYPTFDLNLSLVRAGLYPKHFKFCFVMGEFWLLCAFTFPMNNSTFPLK
jgi:hypothetical protein